MKIVITYIPSETREADLILRFARSLMPRAKVRKSAAHPPQICVYLTSSLPRKDCGTTKST